MTTIDTAPARLIAQFGLQPHPEGGFYRETYRATTRILPTQGVDSAASATVPADVRAASTAIYYLLCADAYSAWHRIRSDEMWHFYAGDPLDVHVILPDGSLQTHHLGDALAHPQCVFQACVAAGHWFAAERARLPGEDAGRLAGAIDSGATASQGFSLAGCTVAPGFEFAEFELADPTSLKLAYPAHAALIERLGPRVSSDTVA